ncbi:MAG TPA: hypothetical protein VKU39_17175 [Streptosporangiaceae bacterium]|nr:hypothetical protein [Streptosporangiaceae bacterium]
MTATSDVLRTLHDIGGFETFGGGLTEAEGQEDVWTSSAYATDEAIAQVRARGARVEVVLDADTRLAQLNREAEQARARLRDIERETEGERGTQDEAGD